MKNLDFKKISNHIGDFISLLLAGGLIVFSIIYFAPFVSKTDVSEFETSHKEETKNLKLELTKVFTRNTYTDDFSSNISYLKSLSTETGIEDIEKNKGLIFKLFKRKQIIEVKDVVILKSSPQINGSTKLTVFIPICIYIDNRETEIDRSTITLEITLDKTLKIEKINGDTQFDLLPLILAM